MKVKDREENRTAVSSRAEFARGERVDFSETREARESHVELWIQISRNRYPRHRETRITNSNREIRSYEL